MQLFGASIVVEWNCSNGNSNVALNYISIKRVGLRRLQFRDQSRGMLCTYQNIIETER
jgi:hypothetical protein